MTALLIAHAALAMVANAAQAAVAMATSLLTDPNMLDTMSWGLIVGVVTPLLTSIVQQPRWSTRTRAVIGAVVSVLVGIGTCLANGSFDEGQTLIATIAVVMVAAQSSYMGLWKKTGVAPALENATSPSHGHTSNNHAA